MAKKAKDQEQEQLNTAALFSANYESFEDAKKRKEKEEAEMGGGLDINYFKMDKLGNYLVKFTPLHPETVKAGYHGFSIPIRQAWLKINKPGSDKPVNVKVVNAKMAGFETDIFSKFKYLAIASLKEKIEDASGKAKKALEKTLEKINNNGFSGGLKYDYKHLCWIFDMDNRDQGPKLFEISHGLYKDIDELRMKTWEKRVAKDKTACCPIIGVGPNGLEASLAVSITKKEESKMTKYKSMLDYEGGEVEFEDEELEAIMSSPQLQTFLRYNRRSFQATMLFLKQYDAQYSLGVYSSEEFVEAAEALKKEVWAVEGDDSSFDINASSKKKGNDSDEEGEEGLQWADLSEEFEDLLDDGIEDTDDEMKEFRKKLRAYMKQEGISGIKLGRKDVTEDVVAEIEEYYAENGERGVVSKDEEEEEEEAPKPTKKRRSKAKKAEPVVEEEEEKEEEEESEEEESEEEEAPKSTRRRRSKKKEEVVEEEEEEEEEAEEEEEEAPKPTRRKRASKAKKAEPVEEEDEEEEAEEEEEEKAPRRRRGSRRRK